MENEQKPNDVPKDASFTSILREHDVDLGQRNVRKKLLAELAKKPMNDGDGPNGVVAHLSHLSLVPSDIPVLGNVLLKVGDVKTLNLILHSPGGMGTVVEKFVSLCRAQCKRFRVIIPNEAKSAATLIALGADEIVMGAPSELGPIDAQMEVIVGGINTVISAQSFIDARDDLLKKHNELVAKGEDTSATLQMLATLDLPFINECERHMDFGRDVARKLLSQHMFARVKDKRKKIDHVVKTLSSVKRFKVHGRSIDGNTARRDLKLKIKLVGQDDPLWKNVWEYYTRAEITMARAGFGKVFETSYEMLSQGGGR